MNTEEGGPIHLLCARLTGSRWFFSVFSRGNDLLGSSLETSGIQLLLPVVITYGSAHFSYNLQLAKRLEFLPVSTAVDLDPEIDLLLSFVTWKSVDVALLFVTQCL